MTTHTYYHNRYTRISDLVELAIWWTFIGVIMFTTVARAADAPATAKVPEAVRTQAVILFQRVQFRQAEFLHMQESVCSATPQCAAARDKLNSAVNAYNTAVPQLLKDSGAPPDYVFDINTEAGTVTAVPNPNAPPPAPKTAEAKPAPKEPKK